MSAYLENLKADLVEAQKKAQEAQAELQRVNLIFQAAHADFQALQRIVEKQTRKEQSATPHAESAVGPVDAAVAETAESVGKPEINKTKLIRDALRQHPGATPSDLFESVKAHVGRAYLYSVLKRLRDNEEVIFRRKKYFLKDIPKEDSKEHALVQ